MHFSETHGTHSVGLGKASRKIELIAKTKLFAYFGQRIISVDQIQLGFFHHSLIYVLADGFSHIILEFFLQHLLLLIEKTITLQ